MTRPGNGPYAGPQYDGLIHMTIAVKQEVHDRILENMKVLNLNRADWIRQAIEEKLKK